MFPDSSTREIPVGSGLVALVDASDYPMLSHFQWSVPQGDRHAYARTTSLRNGRSWVGRMHRMVMLPAPEERIDHINGDKLDNRRRNLRICSNSENMMNRGKQANNRSGYKGVYFHRNDNRWRAVVKVKGEYLYAGEFSDPIDAAPRAPQKVEREEPGAVNALALKHPRHRKDFTSILLEDLIVHYRCWRPLGRLYASTLPSFERCLVVREAVDAGRRVGFVIEGDRRRGYRMTGYVPPQRVWRVKPGKASSEPEARLRAVGRV